GRHYRHARRRPDHPGPRDPGGPDTAGAQAVADPGDPRAGHADDLPRHRPRGESLPQPALEGRTGAHAMTDLVLAALFVMMIMTALAAIRLTDLFAVVIMFSIYSLLAASMFVVMDAVDVALTEAAVDAGIATILMLATLVLTDRWERPSARLRMVPLAVVCLTGAVLLYGTLDMPIFGDASSPANTHLATYYLTESPGEVGLPNVVTSVLASYRAYDTLGEVAVIFTAGVGVLALLGAARSGRGGAAPMRDNPVPRVIAKIMIPLI